MVKYLTLLIFTSLLFGCNPPKSIINHQGLKSETLEVKQISEHVYQHTSFLQTKSFGKVSCNGMIVLHKNEAIIFDTPPDNKTSLELINWVEKNLNCKIKATIPTHFHEDCLGGLEAFHQHKIASYANNLTIKLARLNNSAVPSNGFDKSLQLKVGDKKVLVRFFGEGHTQDNVVGYFPAEKILFGGCLIKELGAGKGNLADANIKDWPLTVKNLKENYPDAKMVIPGHGQTGGPELLDYTIKLFE